MFGGGGRDMEDRQLYNNSILILVDKFIFVGTLSHHLYSTHSFSKFDFMLS